MSVSQSASITQPAQQKKSRKNGDGTTFFDIKRQRWVSSYFDINGKRRTQTFHKKGDAEKWRINQIAIRDSGGNTHPEDPKQTVEEYLNGWLEYRKSKGRPNTDRFYRITVRNRINPHIGKLKVSSLRPASIEQMVDLLNSSSYSAGSIQAVYSTLSKAFNDGVRLGWITNNPMKRVERLKVKSVSTKAIPQCDFEKLYLEALKSESDLARLIAGGKLGLRAGEVAGLRWNDIDLENACVTISRQVQYVKGKGNIYCEPKTLRESPIPLTDNELGILLAHKEAQEIAFVKLKSKPKISALYDGYDPEIVFPNAYGGLQNSKSDIKWFHKLCKSAGVTRYQRHQMRKKAFTDLMLVADLGTTMAYSGHSQSSTLLKHYVTPELEALRVAVKKREIMNGSHF